MAIFNSLLLLYRRVNLCPSMKGHTTSAGRLVFFPDLLHKAFRGRLGLTTCRYLYKCTSTCMDGWVYVCTYVRSYISIYIYTYVIYICNIYIHIYVTYICYIYIWCIYICDSMDACMCKGQLISMLLAIGQKTGIHWCCSYSCIHLCISSSMHEASMHTYVHGMVQNSRT